MYLKLFLLLALLKGALGAKILAIMLVPSTSHNLWNSKYLEALQRRGHSITYVSVEKMKTENPNVRQITFDKLVETVFKDVDRTAYHNVGPIGTALLLDKWDDEIANHIKKSDTFQQFLKMIKSESFDLVIHDVALCAFMLGAVDILKNTPVIGITPFGRPSWVLDLLDSPVSYASDPHSFLPFFNEMTFFERLSNYLYYAFARGTRSLYIIEQNKHAKDAFGENIRHLEEIMNDMNIVMVNSNTGMDFPYSKVPGLIPVGGLHIEPPKPLPKDLQLFLDNAKHGVIYFSLGTFIMSSGLGRDKIAILNDAFKKIAPIKVLWKWESDDLPGKPENVQIIKWAPQNDILGHPNIVLFFSHAGFLSTQEAIYHGVPILGMPFILDQGINLKKCVRRGIAEEIDYGQLTVDGIVQKIRLILEDQKYKRNIKRLSTIFRDSLNSPMERAVFWTEYAIRHKGAQHLSLPTRKLAWYKNTLLDIYLFLLSALFVILFIIYKVLQYIGARLRKTDAKSKKT